MFKKLWPTAFFVTHWPPHANKKSGPRLQKVALSRKRSRRNSVQNGPIERSTALTGTIFVTISVLMSRSPVSEPHLGAQKLTPIPKNVVVTKLFAPKFCAEWSDREVHSSYGDYFCDNFCFYASVTIFNGHRMLKNFGRPHIKKTWPTACAHIKKTACEKNLLV